MITVRREITVAAPVEEVFDFLADARNEQGWNPNVVRIAKTSSGPVGLGSTFEGSYRRGGRMRFVLTAYERPSLLVFEGGGRGMALLATVQLDRESARTSVRMRADMRPRGPLRLLEPLLRPAIERQYADVVDRFRSVVEGRATPANRT